MLASEQRVGLVLSVAVATTCASCSGTDSVADKASASSITQVASVYGTVRLADSGVLPTRLVPASTNQPPAPKDCSNGNQASDVPVTMDTGSRGLHGMIVFASDFRGRPPSSPPRVHEVVIDRCRMSPQLVLASRNDSIRLVNHTDYPFLPEFGTTDLLRVMLRDETREIPLSFGGYEQLRCGFAAPCGAADVVVFYHRIYGPTETRGEYRLTNVPALQPVTLHAWHPLFEDASQTVHLKPGESRRVDFVVKPVAGDAKTGANAAATSATLH